LDFVKEEMEYALGFVTRADRRENEALWTYIRGYLAVSEQAREKSIGTNHQKVLITDLPDLKQRCVDMVEDGKGTPVDNRFILEVLLDFSIAESNKDESLRLVTILKEEAD